MRLTSKEKGDFAEDLAVSFLRRKGYSILDRNYWTSHGELDIIAKLHNKTVFFEVKSVSRETLSNVSYETFDPSQNMHERKLKHLFFAIQHYLNKKDPEKDSFTLKLLLVEYSKREKKAKFTIFDLL